MGRAVLVVYLGSLLLFGCVSSEEPGGDFRQLDFNSDVYASNFSDPSAAHLGAKLYDHWFVEAQTEYHPLWQPSDDLSISKADSWRCVSCHEWDFMGKKIGVDMEGNIIRIRNSSLLRAHESMLPRDVYATIKFGSKTLPSHGFKDVLTDEEIYQLTRFIKDGLVPPNEFLNGTIPFINLKTGRALGNKSEGEFYYISGTKQNCQDCHNESGVSTQGREIILGKLAIEDPWQFLHRMQHGIPHSNINFDHDMEDFLLSEGLLNKNVIITNILTYAQNSLSKSLEGENVIRGANLYDDLFRTKSMFAVGTNPQWTQLYPNISVLNVEETWRCSSCHSWSYGGRSAAVPTLQNTTSTIAEIKDIIGNGLPDGSGGQWHNYQTNSQIAFSEQDKIDLAYFIKQNIIDPDSFIPNLLATEEQGKRGKDLYTQNLFFSTGVDNGECVSCPKCSTCHLSNGTGQFASRAENLYTRVIANRLRTFHRIRFGNPGFSMVGTTTVGLNENDAADIMIYINQCFAPEPLAYCSE